MGAMAADALAFVVDQELVRPIVFGHSMGGRVALHAALRRPDLARALVLVDVGPELSAKGAKIIGDFIAHNIEFQVGDVLVTETSAPIWGYNAELERAMIVGAPTDEMGSMISGILGEIDDRWSEIFQAAGQSYAGPRIVLFRNATNGGRCGMAQSAMGPFYCPPDKQIFLDTGFFREVETRFHGCQGSACKFTAAYIIAHEAGHHIQNLLGILPKVTAQQQQLRADGNKAAANALQVRVELQADCLSGIWVNREEKKRPGFIEAGDIDGALRTASAIGDDTLQRQATGRVVPDSFTHGSAEQRKRWFMTGYQQGTLKACDTFSAGAP
jgi:predicted metalloprotease